ncbi:hypothetical protein [Anaerosporobacter sp.]|uniref:hypothetical protein n=1 Tax=Anaerosporobacter sp. TaxID=1872529 RepID=UPI00286EFAA4|nr:hypothetical protein [Anaerosporobacter sp.]
MKPILFNTQMVQAILEGRKTCTRRLIKYKYSNTEMKIRTDKYGTRLIEIQKDIEGVTHGRNDDGSTWNKLLGYIEPKPKYKVGDVLYVRETFCPNYFDESIARCRNGNKNAYKADYNKKIVGDVVPEPKWKPSIHMPKEAARIFLKVTSVRYERLQDITEEEIENEGCEYKCPYEHRVYMRDYESMCYVEGDCHNTICHCDMSYEEEFAMIWDSTVDKKQLEKYGWNANPWVWVYEFERIGDSNGTSSKVSR